MASTPGTASQGGALNAAVKSGWAAVRSDETTTGLNNIGKFLYFLITIGLLGAALALMFTLPTFTATDILLTISLIASAAWMLFTDKARVPELVVGLLSLIGGIGLTCINLPPLSMLNAIAVRLLAAGVIVLIMVFGWFGPKR